MSFYVNNNLTSQNFVRISTSFQTIYISDEREKNSLQNELLHVHIAPRYRNLISEKRFLDPTRVTSEGHNSLKMQKFLTSCIIITQNSTANPMVLSVFPEMQK